MSSQYSLLPDNRSPLERGLELAFTELLTDMAIPYPHLLNPKKTAAQMLPYLAQERGVIDWDPSAPESEQRLTVENAWPVRRYAGTIKGITLAINSLEFSAEVTPWHKMTPKGNPYTFEVVAFKGEGVPISRDIAYRIEAQINDAKSERDNHKLYLAFSLGSSLSLAGACHQLVYTDMPSTPKLPDKTPCIAPLSLSGACGFYVFTDFSPGAKL